MGKGKKITPNMKRQIACRYADGEELASIAADLDIHPGSLSRLQHDDGYKEILGTLESAVSEEATSKLKRSIRIVIDELLSLSSLSSSNEVVHEAFTRTEADGRKIRVNQRTLKVDPKILAIKCAANGKLLDAFLDLVEGNTARSTIQQVLQQREELLRAYGITPPATPEREADSTADETADATTQERTLRVLLADLLTKSGN